MRVGELGVLATQRAWLIALLRRLPSSGTWDDTRLQLTEQIEAIEEEIGKCALQSR